MKITILLLSNLFFFCISLSLSKNKKRLFNKQKKSKKGNCYIIVEEERTHSYEGIYDETYLEPITYSLKAPNK